MSPVRYESWNWPKFSGSRYSTPESKMRSGSLLVSSYTTILRLPTTTVRRSLLGAGQRLLHERVLARRERAPRHLHVGEHRGRNDHGLELGIVQELLVIPGGLDGRIAPGDALEAAFVDVARVTDLDLREIEQRAE